MPGSSRFTIATWNVNGIRARHTQLHAWLEREHPDVLCLQELKATPDQIPAALCGIDDYWCYWHGGKGYSGVAMLVSKIFALERPQFEHPPFDFEHRIVTTTIGEITIASVYVPNGGKDFTAKMQFLEALDAYAATMYAAGRTLVVCGDLNVTRTDQDVHPKERKPQAIGQLPEERTLFERILARGLVDIGRELEPNNDHLFTWWAPWRNLRERNIGWRIDYVLASQSLARTARSCLVEHEYGTSDHALVVATFTPASEEQSP
jgi:exodeoxyribonuclease-3